MEGMCRHKHIRKMVQQFQQARSGTGGTASKTSTSSNGGTQSVFGRPIRGSTVNGIGAAKDTIARTRSLTDARGKAEGGGGVPFDENDYPPPGEKQSRGRHSRHAYRVAILQ